MTVRRGSMKVCSGLITHTAPAQLGGKPQHHQSPLLAPQVRVGTDIQTDIETSLNSLMMTGVISNPGRPCPGHTCTAPPLDTCFLCH